MKKVLVVDDDPALAELIAEFCRLAGYDTHVETDSLSAFDKAVAWRPDLITLDLEMPGVNGIELLRQFQSRPQTSRIPVVVISVVARGALEEGALKGARKVFEKPLRFQALMDQLEQLMSSPAPARQPEFEPYSKVPS